MGLPISPPFCSLYLEDPRLLNKKRRPFGFSRYAEACAVPTARAAV